jgi:hypothetical protein
VDNDLAEGTTRLIPTILGLSFVMACTTSNGDIFEETETDASSAESESGSIDGGESETGTDAPPPSCEAPIRAVVTPFQVSLELWIADSIKEPVVRARAHRDADRMRRR